MLSRRQALDVYDELLNAVIAESRVPLWERKASATDARITKWQASTIERLRHFPIVMLMPALSRPFVQSDLATMHRDALSVAIASVMHRRRHDAWPSALADLSPDLLPSVPIDQFDGAPLRYRVVDGTPRLYSVGADRDDDDGRHHPEANRWRPVGAPHFPVPYPAIADGDWQLWPPVIEPILVFSPESRAGG